MITNMQLFFQRHYKWLFGALLVIIVVSFVFAYGPASQMSAKDMMKKNESMFLGYNMANQEVVEDLARQAAVGLWLKTGFPPFNAESLQTLVVERIIEQTLADRLNIPTPTEENLAGYIATLPVFQDESGSFSKDKYESFKKDVAQQFRVGEAFLGEQIVQRWRLDQVADVMEQTGFVMPETLQREYALTQTRYEVVLGNLAANLNPSEAPSDKDVESFYNDNKQSYKTSEKRSGVYYSLGSENFISQVAEPTQEELQNYFDRIAMRFIKWQVTDENGNVTGAEPTAPTLEENKDETIALYKQAKAARGAAEAVDAIVQKIYTDKIEPGSKEWNELIQASGLSITEIDAAAKADTIEGVDPKAIEILFTRELPGKAYSEAFMTENGGGFVLLSKVEEPRTLTLEEAKAEGLADDAAAYKSAKEFQAEIPGVLIGLLEFENADAFKAAAQERGFTLSEPEVFTLSEPAKEIKSNEMLKRLAQVQVGDVAQYATSTDAQVAYVVMKEVPLFDVKNPQGAKLKKSIERGYQRMNIISYLDEWASKEAAK